jgi:acetyl-CoA carboxylase beta subunit
MLANQKRQTAVHDTHGQYNKMPKITPQELGQMKIEKEYQDRLTRQRNEELRTKSIQQARIQQGGQATVSAIHFVVTVAAGNLIYHLSRRAVPLVEPGTGYRPPQLYLQFAIK